MSVTLLTFGADSTGTKWDEHSRVFLASLPPLPILQACNVPQHIQEYRLQLHLKEKF